MSTAVDNLAVRIRDMVSLAVEEEDVTLTEVAFTLLTAAIATLSGVQRAEETAALLSAIAKRLENEGYDALEGHRRRQAQ
jgi:N-acetylglucosamine kinase-like BadF-type ATPase